MPDIDVTELLSDPDLCDTFTVINRIQNVGTDGVAIITSATITPVSGYVGPAGDNALNRLPEYQMMGKTLQVITQQLLRGPSNQNGQSYMPDLIVWPITNGDTYVVANLEDYSQFGGGFVSATCSTIDFINQAPQ